MACALFLAWSFVLFLLFWLCAALMSLTQEMKRNDGKKKEEEEARTFGSLSLLHHLAIPWEEEIGPISAFDHLAYLAHRYGPKKQRSGGGGGGSSHSPLLKRNRSQLWIQKTEEAGVVLKKEKKKRRKTTNSFFTPDTVADDVWPLFSDAETMLQMGLFDSHQDPNHSMTKKKKKTLLLMRRQAPNDAWALVEDEGKEEEQERQSIKAATESPIPKMKRGPGRPRKELSASPIPSSSTSPSPPSLRVKRRKVRSRSESPSSASSSVSSSFSSSGSPYSRTKAKKKAVVTCSRVGDEYQATSIPSAFSAPLQPQLSPLPPPSSSSLIKRTRSGPAAALNLVKDAGRDNLDGTLISISDIEAHLLAPYALTVLDTVRSLPRFASLSDDSCWTQDFVLFHDDPEVSTLVIPPSETRRTLCSRLAASHSRQILPSHAAKLDPATSATAFSITAVLHDKK